MLRVFLFYPWLFVWPSFFGLALASFRGSRLWLFAIGCLLHACRWPVRVLALGVFLGYLFGNAFLPVGWKNVPWSSYLHRVQNVTPRIETGAVGWAGKVRAWGTGRLRQALPTREATLAAGMLYGDATFSADDKLKIRAAGISHIVAVSGANILFLLLLVRRILYRMIRAKRWRQWADRIGVLMIVIITGASASVLRAGLMLVLLGGATSFGRRSSFPRLMLLSAFVLLLFEPRRLVFDAGFLLSYLACIGLIHAKGKGEDNAIFEKIEIRSTGYTWLWTSPFQLWFFGGVTWIGLAANAFVLFVVPWIQALAIVAIILPQLAVTNWILEMCLRHIWVVVDFMSRHAESFALMPRTAFIVMAVAYVMLIVALIHKRMSFWTRDVSIALDIVPLKRGFEQLKAFCLLPLLVDEAPDLLLVSLFSMLGISASKLVKAP